MGKLTDLTGQTFNRLIVISRASNSKRGEIYWNCVCSCPNKTETVVYGHSLVRGKTKSCGCLHKEIVTKDLTGQVFGRLSVISRALSSKEGKALWHCICACSNKSKIIVRGSSLISGRTNSCGCLRREKCLKDLTGQTFNRLTVVSRAPNSKDGRARWNCVCSCTNKTKKIVYSGCLIDGTTKSCGCFQKEQLAARNLKYNYCVSKSSTEFLNRVEQLLHITIEREFELFCRYFDGRYKKYLIEIDSDYWHSTKKAQTVDIQKTQLAEKNGFKLLRVKVNNLKEVEPALHKYATVLSVIVN